MYTGTNGRYTYEGVEMKFDVDKIFGAAVSFLFVVIIGLAVWGLCEVIADWLTL